MKVYIVLYETMYNKKNVCCSSSLLIRYEELCSCKYNIILLIKNNIILHVYKTKNFVFSKKMTLCSCNHKVLHLC